MIELKTYADFYKYMKAFSKKQLNLLVVVSRGGLGKTFTAEEALMEEAPLTFTGHVTPMSLYIEMLERNKEEKDFIAIFDDVDLLIQNKTNVALLKQVCDTRAEKIIRYSTTSRALGKEDRQFETSCKVLMLMNSLKTGNQNLDALITRAHLIYFNPSDVEILNHMKTFAEDKEIISFMDTYAPFSKTLNLRVYIRAKELKASELNWKDLVVDELNIDSRLFEIEMLLKKYNNDKERIEHFSASRPSYYRFKKLFLSKNPEYEKK